MICVIDMKLYASNSFVNIVRELKYLRNKRPFRSEVEKKARSLIYSSPFVCIPNFRDPSREVLEMKMGSCLSRSSYYSKLLCRLVSCSAFLQDRD